MDAASSNDHLICKYLQPAHELNDAKILPCGETVCQACIAKSVDPDDELKLDCLLCKGVHMIKDIIPNKLVNNLLENNRKRVSVSVPKENKALETLKKLSNELTEKFEFKNELLNKVVVFAREDVSLKVESLKVELDKLENSILHELCDIEEQFQCILENQNYSHIIEHIRQLEQVEDSKEDKKELLKQSDFYVKELQQMNAYLSKMVKTVKFTPNDEILPLNYSFVGSLKLTNKCILNITSLKEMKKKIFYNATTKDPEINLNLVGLTLDWNSEIILSERNENRLIKIDKYCSYIDGSNYLNELSNSCGICVNSLHQILVTDAKYNTVLKFNSEFHLIQSVGPNLGKRFGKLNYPWGITSNLDTNDDYVYVCDYKNSRCVRFASNLVPVDVFNLEKEQKPRRVQVKLNLVYILHKSESEIFISLFDKSTRSLLRSIKQNETNVKSFYVDDLFNIFTIGQLNNNDQNQNLCCYNKYNQLLSRTLLLVENKIWDFTFKVVDDEYQLYCASSEGLFVFYF